MRARGRRYSPREVAQSLGLHPRTIRREVARGNLPAIRTPSGHYMHVLEEDLTTWLQSAGLVLARSLRYKRRSNQRRPPPSSNGSDDT